MVKINKTFIEIRIQYWLNNLVSLKIKNHMEFRLIFRVSLMGLNTFEEAHN